MTVLPGRYYNFHFTDEETSSKKLSHLTKVSCLEESRVSHILKPIPRDSPHPSRGTWVAKWIYLLSSVLFSGSVVPDSLWHQPSLSITNSRNLLKLMSFESADSFQPSHLLLSPSSPAFNITQHQGLFQWVSSSHQVARVLELQLVLPMNIQDRFPLGWIGWISLQSKEL